MAQKDKDTEKQTAEAQEKPVDAKEAPKEPKEKPSKSEKADKKDKAQKQIESLQAEVEELKKKAEGERNDYLRLMAEFETFRRRSAEDRLNLVSNASADTIKGLLPVLDDCERAMELLAKSSDEAAKQGTELIYNKLMAYLKGRGLSVIEAKGAMFDTDFHEAVTQFPVQDAAQKGMVIDVVQTGYLLNGKILRYAKVVVGA